MKNQLVILPVLLLMLLSHCYGQQKDDLNTRSPLHIFEATINYGSKPIGTSGLSYTYHTKLHPQVQLGLRTGLFAVSLYNVRLSREETGASIPIDGSLFLGGKSFTLEMGGGLAWRINQYGSWLFPKGQVGLRFLTSNQNGGLCIRAGAGMFMDATAGNEGISTSLTPHLYISLGYAISTKK